MIYPVTPNGVEHKLVSNSFNAAIEVIYPVTPNGVEHSTTGMMLAESNPVIYPVTPNGVEHTHTEDDQTDNTTRDLSGNA